MVEQLPELVVCSKNRNLRLHWQEHLILERLRRTPNQWVRMWSVIDEVSKAIDPVDFNSYKSHLTTVIRTLVKGKIVLINKSEGSTIKINERFA